MENKKINIEDQEQNAFNENSDLTASFEPVRKKTNNLGSDQVRHKHSHRRCLEAGNFGFRK